MRPCPINCSQTQLSWNFTIRPVTRVTCVLLFFGTMQFTNYPFITQEQEKSYRTLTEIWWVVTSIDVSFPLLFTITLHKTMRILFFVWPYFLSTKIIRFLKADRHYQRPSLGKYKRNFTQGVRGSCCIRIWTRAKIRRTCQNAAFFMPSFLAHLDVEYIWSWYNSPLHMWHTGFRWTVVSPHLYPRFVYRHSWNIF